jgi:hypothetical protein
MRAKYRNMRAKYIKTNIALIQLIFSRFSCRNETGISLSLRQVTEARLNFMQCTIDVQLPIYIANLPVMKIVAYIKTFLVLQDAKGASNGDPRTYLCNTYLCNPFPDYSRSGRDCG